MSTCNQWDLETLGYRPIMPKTFPKQRMSVEAYICIGHEADEQDGCGGQQPTKANPGLCNMYIK